MRLFQSKRFWWFMVFTLLISGVCGGLYYYNILQKFAPRQAENIFLIDDFEGHPTRNILGSATGTYKGHSSMISARLTQKSYYQKKGGHLEVNYDLNVKGGSYDSGAWGGYYTLLLHSEGGKTQYFNSALYDYLCFFIKGKVGNEKFTVGLADEDWHVRKDSLRLKEIGEYLKEGKVTTKWQKAVIPLDNYYLDRKRLASIGISFEGYLFQEEGEGKGTVYIDNLAFVKDPRSLPGINYPTKELIAEAGVARPKEQIFNLAALLQNLRKRIFLYIETVKLTPRLPLGLVVSKTEPSRPPQPKKTETKIEPRKPKEPILTSLTKRIRTNRWPFKILGASVLLGLSLAGGIRLYYFLLKKRLQLKRKRFEFAHEIKKGLLPITPPQIDGVSFGVRNIPPPEVKGDFYNFVKLDKKKIAIIVGHVFGDGGNILAYLIRKLNHLQYYAPLYQRPAKLLSVLNELLAKDQTNGFLATMIYSVLDADKDIVTFSNAGHDPIMLFHAHNKEVDIYNTLDRTPLGMIADRTFTEQDIQLTSGDSILLHTPGVTGIRNGKDIPFGIDRLKDSVDSNRSSDPNRLIDRTIDEITDFTKGRFQDSELTLVAVRLE